MFFKAVVLLTGTASACSTVIGEWSKKGKDFHVSKLDGGVKSMAPVERMSKNNMDLQCANPTYSPYPDARLELNQCGKFWFAQFTATHLCGAFKVYVWQMFGDHY